MAERSSSNNWPAEEAAWNAAFEAHLRKKQFEKFNLLMCDISTCTEAQRDLLGKILFVDHLDVNYWYDYVEYANQHFSDRKLHIQRLIHKALEILDESKLKQSHPYLMLHLQSIKFKKTPEEMLRYFQNILWKRDIGKFDAELYIAWGEVEKEANPKDSSAALQMLQKVVQTACIVVI